MKAACCFQRLGFLSPVLVNLNELTNYHSHHLRAIFICQSYPLFALCLALSRCGIVCCWLESQRIWWGQASWTILRTKDLPFQYRQVLKVRKERIVRGLSGILSFVCRGPYFVSTSTNLTRLSNYWQSLQGWNSVYRNGLRGSWVICHFCLFFVFVFLLEQYPGGLRCFGFNSCWSYSLQDTSQFWLTYPH